MPASLGLPNTSAALQLPQVHTWDIIDGNLGPRRDSGVKLRRPDCKDAGGLRALDCMEGSDIFIAGTAHCDVWEVVCPCNVDVDQ